MIDRAFKSVFSFFKSVFVGFESAEERKKFSILSVLFGLTIGTYWLFKPLKDSVFLTMVGADYQPWAKMMSIFVVVPVIMIYSKLIDTFPRHKVLYGISTFYALLTLVFSSLILNPSIGMANTVESPDRLLGWLFYLFVESFGSVMVALFWSFVSDTTTPESAKRGYGLIVFGAQTGGVLFPTIGRYLIPLYGSGAAVVLCVLTICSIPLVVYYFMSNVSKKQMKGFVGKGKALEPGKKPKTGFFDGLYLLVTRPYLLGIFGVVSFYEIVITILDFNFKSLAKGIYTGDALTDYLLHYATVTNLVAVICVLSGAGKIGKKLGLTKTLLLLPATVGTAVIFLSIKPILGVAFAIMVGCKGINYALNQPAKEQLYIPTTKDSKYKAKAWIDMFGNRSSKGMGSGFNALKRFVGMEWFALVTLGLSVGLIAVWVYVALFLGKTHAQAVKEDRVVC